MTDALPSPEEIGALVKTPPTLDTPRLVLRPLLNSDAAAIYSFTSDPEVMRYTTQEHHTSLAEAQAFAGRLLELGNTAKAAVWAVTLRDSGRLVGTCALFLDLRHYSAEAAFVLSRDCWGRGYLPEALRAAISYAFNTLGLNRVEGLCMAENSRSARAMEKAGMRFEALLRRYLFIKGAYRDTRIFAVLRRDWDRPDSGAVG